MKCVRLIRIVENLIQKDDILIVPQNGTRRTSTIIFFSAHLYENCDELIITTCSFTYKIVEREMSQMMSYLDGAVAK